MAITLYDIPSAVPAKRGSSANTLKARFALDYKGLAYETEWVEFVDIETVLKRIGASPTSKKPDGRDHYTLPVIHDSKTGAIISDSWKIAEYLDTTYPDKPMLFPSGSAAAIALFEHYFMNSVIRPFFPMAFALICARMSPRSAAYFRSEREKLVGCKLEEYAPPGSERSEKAWKSIKEGLDLLAGFYDRNDPAKPYFLGDSYSYADIILEAFLTTFATVLNPEDWNTIADFNGGRWRRIAARRTEK